METLGDNFPRSDPEKLYNCHLCDYKCSKKYNLDRHLLTCKHLKVTQGDEEYKKGGENEEQPKQSIMVKKYDCPYCDKIYASRNGLWKHTKMYHSKVQTIDKDISNAELIQMLIKENAEFKNMMMGVVTNITNNPHINNTSNVTNSHINSHNNAFNLNLFLNETCKDAMNMSDFINSINLNLEDLENTGRKGYIDGISNIIIKRLNNIEQHMRPLHCSDSKREILYIKDNDKWEKEAEHKPILTNAIKVIANKNIKQIKQWADKNPDCTSSTSRKNDFYLKIVSNSMNGLTKEEGDKNINKIISNVAKEAIIKKS